jgi:hypothetical protein
MWGLISFLNHSHSRGSLDFLFVRNNRDDEVICTGYVWQPSGRFNSGLVGRAGYTGVRARRSPWTPNLLQHVTEIHYVLFLNIAKQIVSSWMLSVVVLCSCLLYLFRKFDTHFVLKVMCLLETCFRFFGLFICFFYMELWDHVVDALRTESLPCDWESCHV